MNYKYYGVLTEEIYNSFSETEMLNFCIENHILLTYVPVTFIEDRPTNEKAGFETVTRYYVKDLSYKFSDKFKNEFYLFLRPYFNELIETNLMMFNKNFDINTFGFSENKKKKHALKTFNELFLKLIKNEQILSGKKLIVLKSIQSDLINALMEEETMINCYLFGYGEYFKRELFDTEPLLLEIFEFENILSILLSLNRKFQFEKDDIFIPKSIAQIIFQDYSDEFNSLKQLEFIEQQLSIETNKIHSFIVSLFYFFKKELKIKTPSAKLFQEIINSFFNFNIGGIKLGDPTNRKHEIRLSEIHQDWIQFDEKRR